MKTHIAMKNVQRQNEVRVCSLLLPLTLCNGQLVPQLHLHHLAPTHPALVYASTWALFKSYKTMVWSNCGIPFDDWIAFLRSNQFLILVYFSPI